MQAKYDKERPVSHRSIVKGPTKPTVLKNLYQIIHGRTSFIKTHDSAAIVFDNNTKNGLKNDRKLSHYRTVVNFPKANKGRVASQELLRCVT